MFEDCSVADGFRTTIGLCDVGGFENLPPGTAAHLKTNVQIKYKR